MSGFGKALLTIGVIGSLISGYKVVDNWNSWLDVDRKIEQTIGMSGGVTKADSKNIDEITMKTLLEDAEKNSYKWKGDNTALLYDVKMYEVDELTDILNDGIKRAKEIGFLDRAYKTGTLEENAPEWVKITWDGLNNTSIDDRSYDRMISSQIGATIETIYESFNDAVSGGQQASGDKVKNKNYALVNILDDAAGNAWWSPFDCSYTDMNNAWSETYFSLIYANMGQLDKAIEKLEAADKILSEFDDDVDLAILRSDLPTYQMKYIKEGVKSAISEFKELNDVPDNIKYTQGWWGQLQKKAESLGASECYMGAISDNIGGKYGQAAGLWVIPLVAFGALGLYGMTESSGYY